MIKIAEGLQYCHSFRLVHGNLCPTDIMIDVSGNPKIAFPSHPDRCRMGSPVYLAPEVRRSMDFDGRADIWSFGAFMFELLTEGKRPFQSRTFEETRLAQETTPLPIRQIDDALPKELEHICSRCLSREIENRYSTASDLAEDLRQCKIDSPSFWRRFRPNRGVQL